jgi:hypothetical protein
MSRQALEDQRYEVIKAHILNPDESLLPDHLREALDRTVQASKLLEKNPVQKHAVAILMAKYPRLSRSQAYEDCNRAVRLFNSIHTFSYDYWHAWLLQDIADLMNAARLKGDLKARAMAQRNLLDAIGDRPETEIDPKLIEKHNFTINLQVNNQSVNIDFGTFMKMPIEARQLITSAIHQEINEEDAERIMNS